MEKALMDEQNAPRRVPIAWILAAVPLIIGLASAVAVVTGVMVDLLFVGRFQIALSALLVIVGAVLTALFAGILTFVTRSERKRRREIEAARKAERERAHLAEAESRRRFFRRLDHELKNPLTILQLGLSNLHPAPDERESLIRMEQTVRRLSKLVEDLRRLADLEAGGVERERVDLREVLEEAIELANDADHPRAVSLTVQQIPWSLSPVSGDRDLLAVAFRNLIDNALKYTDMGRRIEVRASENGKLAAIEIADEGRGIPDADLPYIGEELYRAGNALNVQGSGLGLSLVQRIIELHKGKLDVRSRANVGTVFTVYLPLEDEHR